MDGRHLLGIDLGPAVVGEQAVDLLLDVRELRVAEAGDERQVRDPFHQVLVLPDQFLGGALGTNDHGPQPCESLEYTVFLTDNPYSTDLVLYPAKDGVDPLFALRWPEMPNPGNLMAVAWIEGRDGRILQVASDRCPDPK